MLVLHAREGAETVYGEDCESRRSSTLENSGPRATLDFPEASHTSFARLRRFSSLHTPASIDANSHIFLDAHSVDSHAICAASRPAVRFDSDRSALITEANATTHPDCSDNCCYNYFDASNTWFDFDDGLWALKLTSKK